MQRPTLFRRAPRYIACLVLLGSSTSFTQATELIYYPINPSFGGNPMYGPVLLNSAQATNKHKEDSLDKDVYGIEEKSAVEQFNETLERSIVSRLAASASSKIMDEQGNFIPGTLETQNFTISVADAGGGFLQITTTDRFTGAATTFQVSKR